MTDKISTYRTYLKKIPQKLNKMQTQVSHSYSFAKGYSKQQHLKPQETKFLCTKVVLKHGVAPILPEFFTILGAPIPIPGAMVVGFALGKSIQKLLRKIIK